MSESWEVQHGDCLDLMRALPDASVDAVVTDPPYGIRYQSARRTDTERFKPVANDEQPFVWFLWDAARVLRPGGHLVCFCRHDVQEPFRIAINWAGLRVKSHIVWDRQAHGLGDLSCSFAPQHDVAWHAVKGSAKMCSPTRPVSVIRSARVAADKLEHPTQKPIELMRYLVRAVTPPGGLVLDPFTGSGSTGVAAVREGFRFLGMEREAEYVEIARRRLAEATTQVALPLEAVE